MILPHGRHLAYCTNIHRGQSWAETWDALRRHTLAVRDRVVEPCQPYAIGLRLSAQAALELADPKTLQQFQKWLDQESCYVFTINGFPYGTFHGARVKEQVYVPDWTTVERLEFTCRLFDLLSALLPAGVEGSVSTVPGSFKAFIRSPEQVRAMRDHLWRCVDHIDQVARRSGHTLHLGLEPEPLCFLETSVETADFMEAMRQDRPGDERLGRHLGVNYDTCHLAVEFENPAEALGRFRQHGIRLSKIHLSSALQVKPDASAREALAAFAEDIYFHQVIARTEAGALTRYPDLDEALRAADGKEAPSPGTEWRIHYHIPLHCPATELFQPTTAHLLGVLDALQADPNLCSHLEMETYTWEVLPESLKHRDVVEQLVGEYEWTLRHLRTRGLA